MRYKIISALVLLSFCEPVWADVYEPKEVKDIKQLKEGEGIVRLSLRAQRQFIETAYLYFVEILPNGEDGTQILQFERGAGVPIMGTNMIDVFPKYYRVPKGRYRLLAYTVACQGVPQPGSVCTFYGNRVPTGRYETGSPVIEIASNTLTDGGDFIIEYVKDVNLDTADLFKDRFADDGYAVRWRGIAGSMVANFTSLQKGPAPVVPKQFESRIECNVRPKTKKVQFPFRCPEAPTH